MASTKNSNKKDLKTKALDTINAALIVLESFPELTGTDTATSMNLSTNPIAFLVDLFKSTAGYEAVIRVISNIFTYNLPKIETAIKTVILEAMKNLIGCSTNPYVSDDILKEGITFSLKEIDIMDTLSTSPLDEKVGQYFYFGCEDIETTDRLKDSTDFNAFLWYVKNKAVTRVVWGQTEAVDESSDQLLEENGIMTLSFHTDSSLTDAEGNTMYLQTPRTDVLHVYLGNTAMKNYDSTYDSRLISNSTSVNEIMNEIEALTTQKEEYEDEYETLKEAYQEQTEDDYESTYEEISAAIENIEAKIEEYEAQLEELDDERKEILSEYKSSLASATYRDIEKNYFHNKTLYEFNQIYMNSISLFDPKTLLSQLLNALSGVITMDVNFSYSRKLIQEETLKIVQNIIESDDSTVSDCFFSFSNDEYNAMLEKAELTKCGLYSNSNCESNGVTIDAETLLSSLNTISSSSTQEEITSVIEGTLTEISASISSASYETDEEVDANVQFNLIENMLNQLVTTLTLAVLSPAIYILFLVNRKVLGYITNLGLNDILAAYKQTIVKIVRKVRDIVIDGLYTEIMKSIGSLATELTVKLSAEQMVYYTILLKRCLDCIRKSEGTTYDWTMDEVGVDIEEEEEESEEESESDNC